MNYENLASLDKEIIGFLRTISRPLSHTAIFVVFFWFGLLKIFDTSPANPLVASLLERTFPIIAFKDFIFFFGIYEMVIGITFLIPNLERLALFLLIPHMIMTSLPLFLLPAVTWQGLFTPTLEGQYIIKNLVIIALAITLAAQIKPINATRTGNKE